MDKQRKYVPSAAAIEAAGIAYDKFFQYSLEHPITMNDGEWQAHYFKAGFYRGIQWLQPIIDDKVDPPDPEPFV
jgi:hypothetical protein